MGEIGIARLEYLYEVSMWELVLIARGYRCRCHAGWEQARLVAYNARFCMGSRETPPTVAKWLPLPWDRLEDDGPSDEEIEKVREELRKANEEMNLGER